MGGSHGMGGGAAAVAPAVQVAPQAAPVVQAVAPPAPPKPKPKQTREQQLLAQVKGNPAALMQMSDRDALDTVKAIAAQPIATDGTQNDTFCQRWLNATGLANEMPEVLDDVAFGKARRRAGANKLYHSDMPYDSKAATAVKTLQQLQTGKTAYASCGTHGSGTYLDYDAVGNATVYAGTHGSQVKMFLNNHARIAKAADLKQARINFETKHPKTYQYLISSHTNTQWGKSELKTIWLTSSGYNAYDNGDWGYKVAYSRKALTICSTIKSRQQVERKGTNW